MPIFDPEEVKLMSRDALSFPVLESVAEMVDHCTLVHFHPEHLKPAVVHWGHLLRTEGAWEHPCHFYEGEENTARWIFVLDVLNHCFWPDRGEEPWTCRYAGCDYSGYWGLAAALKAAMESGIPLTDSTYLSRITRSQLENIFEGRGVMPLCEERARNLREAGEILLSQWAGDIVNLIEDARENAVDAVLKIVSSFPSFRDEALYRGRPVYFWKRAQLFVSDLHSAFGGKGFGTFQDMDRLTAFADYKLPQVLRCLNVISYEPDLRQRIDGLEPVMASSLEEVEIRAMTIWAVEALRGAFQDEISAATSTQIDGWLWRLGQLEPFRQKPYHRCRTIFY